MGLAGIVTVLYKCGTPLWQIATWTVYCLVCVILIGTLIFRALFGRTETLFTDCSWGSVVGLGHTLLGWALFAAAGVQQWLILWPVATLTLFALVPRLKSSWRGDGRPSPPLISWAVTTAVLTSLLYQATTWFRTNPLPPSGRGYFVDTPWHLGVAYEAQRGLIPTAPENAIEGTLHYHFLPDALFGAVALVTHNDLAVVLTRLWVPTLTAVAVATTAALAVRVVGGRAAAVVAAVITVAQTSGLLLWNWTYAIRVIYPDSPTSIFAVGVASLVVLHLITLVRDGALTVRQWILLAPTLTLCVGCKPSIIPCLAGGLGLVVLVRLVIHRRLRLMEIAVGVAMVAAVGLSVPLFASPSGSKIGPFSLLSVFGDKSLTGKLLVFAVQSAKGYLLIIPAVVAVVLILRRRFDPVAVLLGGIVVTGWSLSWMIAHPGRSQLFFWNTALPFAAVLTGWGVAIGWRERRRERGPLTYAALLTVAVAVAEYFVATRLGAHAGMAGMMILAVLLLVAGLLAVLTRTPLIAAFFLAFAAALTAALPSSLAQSAIHGLPQIRSGTVGYRQTSAALWLKDHAPLDALVATNSHCAGRQRQWCDARQFWVSGFSGRRVLIGGYGVSPSQLALAGQQGHFAWTQPYHDQQALSMNDGAFNAPNAANLAWLRAKGVTWLVGDSSTSAVSPKLATLVPKVYDNGVVSIYRLR